MSLKLTRPICFIDLETTGTDTNVDKIVEICVLKLMIDGTESIKTKRINPGIAIPKQASDVHGITDELVKDEPTFKQFAKSLHELIKDCDIAGFRSNSFDVPLLFNEFVRAGVDWDYRGCSLIDVGNIFVIQEPRTLSAAYKFYVGKELDDAHSAEADIVATKEILLMQMGRYNDLPTDIKKLALFSNYGKEILDANGCFTKDEKGFIVFNFGKHKGVQAHTEKHYLNWMITKGGFPKNTIQFAELALKNN